MTLAETYSTIHRAGLAAIATGDTSCDAVPVDSDPRWGLSLVALADDTTQHHLAPILAGLRQALPADDYTYSPGALHLTVFSVEGFTGHVSAETLAHYSTIVSEAVSRAGPFRVHFGDVIASRGGVLLTGYPDNNSLPQIRSHIADAVAAHGPVAHRSPDYDRTRNTAHMSLAVFTASPQPRANLVDFLTQEPGARAHTQEVVELALVTYAFNPKHLDVETIQTFPL